ncbi:MAG: phosphate/phosphite/phosphonate ABC transporter substrate-binding protein [Trueperaceae bacterium]|nr:phosphate/phosphite/phosphonate ABC transporter substrate-binding protein [Trueperaceae bacterium]
MKQFIAKLMAVALVVTLVPFAASAQDGDVPTELVLGMVPSREAGAIADSLEPLADLLSERLLIPVETFISTNYVGLVEAMGNGRVDIGFFGPSAMVQAIDRYDAVPITASVRYGSSTYKTQFNVRCDGPIESYDDFRGASIAFVDPGSASGYQFPYVFLKNQYGIDANDDMSTVFAGSHDAAALAVYNGDVDIATSFNDVREDLLDEYPDIMEQVCVLGYTGDIPNDGQVVRAGLDSELAAQIQQALIDIAETEEGNALVNELFNVTAFDPVSSEAYDPVREVLAEFQ